jgi:hypothetical protein
MISQRNEMRLTKLAGDITSCEICCTPSPSLSFKRKVTFGMRILHKDHPAISLTRYVVNERLCGLVVWVSGYRSRGPGFYSRPYQIFWERGPLSLVRTIEELLEWKRNGSGRGNSLRWPRNTLYTQRLALTSPTSGGHSVGIVRLRTKATEFSLV